MELDKLLGQLRAGQYQPVYFLHGEEPYFIDVVDHYVEEHALNEVEKAFNLTILYGKETDHLQVLDAARRYPAMAQRQVVILREAQEMKSLDKLAIYLEKPLESTVLVICHKHKKYNLNSAFGKVLQRQAVVFEGKKLYDNQVPDWIIEYMRQRKRTIPPGVAALIAEYLGADLSRITNELDKLALNVPEGSTISEQTVEQFIGISREYNVFEFQKALGQRDTVRAFRMAKYFAENSKKAPLVVILSTLYGFFSKVYMIHFLNQSSEKELLEKLELRNAFFLKDYRAAARQYSRPQLERIFAILREYDLKSKGVDFNSTNTPEGALIVEITWQITSYELGITN